MKQGKLTRALLKFRLWLADGGCRIRTKSGDIVPLRENEFQQKIMDAVCDAAFAGKPIRVVVLKSRKRGVSTLMQALGYFLTRELQNWECQTVAHTAPETATIFRITQFIAKRDRKSAGKLLIEFPHNSRFTTRTAGGHFIASGSTTNFLHLSELAKWPPPLADVQEQLASVLESVPTVADSLIVIESTASGKPEGEEFKNRWESAQRGEGGWIPIFGGWLDDPDCTKEPGDLVVEAEEEYLVRLGATRGNLAWRRDKIVALNRDPVLFKQEYPATPDEAFRVAEGRIFPMLVSEKHWYQATPNELEMAGYDFYRGIDFGGTNPFACVWLAHKAGKPGFTVDPKECTNVWRELTRYSRDDHGQPVKTNDHTIDAIRYVVMNCLLTGHVHVYREVYIRNSAAGELSPLDLADLVKKVGRESYVTSVADRSRPDTINLFRDHGIVLEPSRRPETMIRGEVEDGIGRMQSLMVATHPLRYPPEPMSYAETLMRTARNLGGHDVGMSLEDRVTLLRCSDARPHVGDDYLEKGFA